MKGFNVLLFLGLEGRKCVEDKQETTKTTVGSGGGFWNSLTVNVRRSNWQSASASGSCWWRWQLLARTVLCTITENKATLLKSYRMYLTVFSFRMFSCLWYDSMGVMWSHIEFLFFFLISLVVYSHLFFNTLGLFNGKSFMELCQWVLCWHLSWIHPPTQPLPLLSTETLCYAKSQRGRKSSQTILSIQLVSKCGTFHPGHGCCFVFGGLLTSEKSV